MKHKHYDEIMAWAEGKVIRGRELGGDSMKGWITLDTDDGPTWWHDWEYEIVPEKLVVYVNTYTGGACNIYTDKDTAIRSSEKITNTVRVAVKMVEAE